MTYYITWKRKTKIDKYYVYCHIDPLTKEIVYVGKGCGGRAWDVTRARGNHVEHQNWMKELCSIGYTPDEWVCIISKGLDDKTARKQETNLLHQTGTTRFNMQSGERQHRSKMTNEQAISAFRLRDEGYAHKDIAELYGVSRSAISMLLSGRQWKAVTKGVRIEESI
jgi:hypothetical protein